MSTPLGRTAGNALEVAESVEVLAGGGPADVVELTLALAREMLAGAGRATTSTRPTGCADGSAMDAWRRMIAAQGGDPDAAAADRPGDARGHRARAAGCSPGLDAMAVGLAAWRLGAGRARKEDPVQAGGRRRVARQARRHRCTEGQPLLTLHTDEPERFERALAALDGGVVVAEAGRRTTRCRWSSTGSQRASGSRRASGSDRVRPISGGLAVILAGSGEGEACGSA